MAGRRQLLRIAATSQVVRPFPRAGFRSRNLRLRKVSLSGGDLRLRASGRDRALDVVVGGGGQSGGRLGLAGGAPICGGLKTNQNAIAHVHFARAAALLFELEKHAFRDAMRLADVSCRVATILIGTLASNCLTIE